LNVIFLFPRKKFQNTANPQKRYNCSLYVLIVTPVFPPCQEKYDYFPLGRIKDLCDSDSIMLTHDTIWLAIDRLAQSCGYSTSGLAKRAGLDPTSFNRSKRIGVDGKPRWPSTESVARVLDATGSTMTEFIELIGNPASSPKKQSRIPVISFAVAGKSEHFNESGIPLGSGWDHIHFPHAPDEEKSMYALEVTGTQFHPLFREGDRLIIAPQAPLRKGDRVVVRTANGKILAKELHRQTASKVELKSLVAGENDIVFSPKDISWIARIIWVSQ
jgi:phage repressor protein C with HTH and peptisase S24 domain